MVKAFGHSSGTCRSSSTIKANAESLTMLSQGPENECSMSSVRPAPLAHRSSCRGCRGAIEDASMIAVIEACCAHRTCRQLSIDPGAYLETDLDNELDSET